MVPVQERAFPPPEPWRWELLALGFGSAALLLYAALAMREAPLTEVRDQLTWGGREDIADALRKVRRWLWLDRLGLPSVAILLARPGLLPALLGVVESGAGGEDLKVEALSLLTHMARHPEAQSALLSLGALDLVRRQVPLLGGMGEEAAREEGPILALFLLSSLAQSPEGARQMAEDAPLLSSLVRALASSLMRGAEVDRYAQRALLRTLAALAEDPLARRALVREAVSLDALLSTGALWPDSIAWQHHARLLVTLRATAPLHFPRLTLLVPPNLPASGGQASEAAPVLLLGALTSSLLALPWALAQVGLGRVWRPFRPLSLYHRRRLRPLLVRTPLLAASLFLALHGTLLASDSLSALLASPTPLHPSLPSPRDENGRVLALAALPLLVAPLLAGLVCRVAPHALLPALLPWSAEAHVPPRLPFRLFRFRDQWAPTWRIGGRTPPPRLVEEALLGHI